MFVDLLRILFYTAIAIPFFYMAFDVIFYILKNGIHFFNYRAKPVLIHYMTSIFS